MGTFKIESSSSSFHIRLIKGEADLFFFFFLETSSEGDFCRQVSEQLRRFVVAICTYRIGSLEANRDGDLRDPRCVFEDSSAEGKGTKQKSFFTFVQGKKKGPQSLLYTLVHFVNYKNK